MKITIEQVCNGFIVTDDEDGTESRVVFSYDEGIQESVVTMFCHIQELLGHGGSKHDEKRIFVRLEKQNESRNC